MHIFFITWKNDLFTWEKNFCFNLEHLNKIKNQSMTDITMTIDPNTPDFTDNFFNSSDQKTLENNIGIFSGKYGSIKFVPQKDEEEIKEHSGEEFIFIVDCSGSMSSPSIELTSECLIIFMKSLPENCFFNVIRFGTEYGVGKLKK